MPSRFLAWRGPRGPVPGGRLAGHRTLGHFYGSSDHPRRLESLGARWHMISYETTYDVVEPPPDARKERNEAPLYARLGAADRHSWRSPGKGKRTTPRNYLR